MLYKIFSGCTCSNRLHFTRNFIVGAKGCILSLGRPRNCSIWQAPFIWHRLVNNLLLGIEREALYNSSGVNWNCGSSWELKSYQENINWTPQSNGLNIAITSSLTVYHLRPAVCIKDWQGEDTQTIAWTLAHLWPYCWHGLLCSQKYV